MEGRSGDRRRARRCWAASPRCSKCPTPTRSTTTPETLGRQARTAPAAGCIATTPSIVGATHDNTAVLAELERLPGAAASRSSWAPPPARCWSRTMEACERVLQRDPPPRGLPLRGRIPAGRAPQPPDRGRPGQPSGLARRRGGGAARPSACWRLARKTGKRVHVLHVTTAEEMELLAEPTDIATVEVTPQHLTLRRRRPTSGSDATRR